jgi:hypothetical protein
MPSPVGSKEPQSYTPIDSGEDLVCKGDPPPLPPSTQGDAAAICTADPVSREPGTLCVDSGTKPAPVRRDVDYYTLSLGAGAIIGADASVTLDRHGHIYFGIGAGVSVSPTIASATLQAGQLQGPSTEPPSSDQMMKFLDGNSVQLSVSAGGAQTGVASSPGGTALEAGVGLPQVSGEFQHNWYALEVPVKW